MSIYIRKYQPLLFSTLSGLLLGFSWPETGGLYGFLFLAFIPLLLLEYEMRNLKISKFSVKIFLHAWWAFFLFNLISTWWIYYASSAGMVMAVVLNSMLMAVVFWLYHKTALHLGEYKALYSLFFYWLGFEWLHYHWELSWPWLSFGNVFANSVNIVQWYEYTGVLGGSLWILAINVFLFVLLKRSIYQNQKIIQNIPLLILIFIVFTAPIITSYSIDIPDITSHKKIEVVVVQPNIDPYNEKFSGLSDVEQAQEIIRLAEQKLTPQTRFIIAPETALPRGYNEEQITDYDAIKILQQFINKHPKISFIIGISSYKFYEPFEEIPETARQTSNGDFYDSFNTAMLLNKNGIQLYHKSKLVLGVERLPFSWLLIPLENLAIDLGGTTGTLGVSPHPYVFSENKSYLTPTDTNEVAFGPVICYESVYGEYFSEFVKRGANVMAIITNDGWWEDTPGYKQHLAYAKLRAIETRRYIARSANTGISAIINPQGKIEQATDWWVKAAIRGNLFLNNKPTFYAIYGDIIGRLSAFLASIMLAYVVARKLNTTQQRLKMER
jgi:apolipoprotein N-acyltransferase